MIIFISLFLYSYFFISIFISYFFYFLFLYFYFYVYLLNLYYIANKNKFIGFLYWFQKYWKHNLLISVLSFALKYFEKTFFVSTNNGQPLFYKFSFGNEYCSIRFFPWNLKADLSSYLTFFTALNDSWFWFNFAILWCSNLKCTKG